MPTGRFQPIVRALLLVAGCVLFGAGVSGSNMRKRNSLHHRHRRSCRRRKRRSSIHPVPIPCRNRATDRLRPQRQVPFLRDMWFRRL
jgi:hypothetical protein